MWCSDCKQDLLIESFAKSKSSRTGYNCICRSCKRIRDQAHYKKNREKIIEHNKQYNQDNKEWFYAYCREYNRTAAQIAYKKEWNVTHPEYYTQYRIKNPDVHRNVRYARRAAINNGPKDYIPLDELFARDNGTCQLCNSRCERSLASIDHIKPLSKGGHHTWQNAQLAHLKCNKIKGNRYETDTRFANPPTLIRTGDRDPVQTPNSE